ncbi:sensor histidine kinase [Niveibacterium sp. SC-1]|uniref:sensor histidine kinase n=1 Tax=Niveibacterium sp. SC-1 TaxID=3135646 RepID=UPI0031203BFE
MPFSILSRRDPPPAFAERMDALREHFDPRRRRFWLDLATVAAFNALFALALTALGPTNREGYFVNLVFSECIGLLIWVGVITSWHLTLRRTLRVLGVGVSIAFGEFVGWHIAAFLLGIHNNPFSNELRGRWPLWLTLCLFATLINFYYFWSRERLARVKAELAQSEAERKARERESARALTAAQLATLQAQIEPHFLFNTLANLRSLIGRDPVLAQQMLDRLITYLRTTLASARAGSSTLGREFALASAYLDIQAIRMGERLRFNLQLPPELEAREIPPMLLQPLVENAIRHGIEPKTGSGTIRLAAEAFAQGLRIRVQDDGVGFGAADTGGTGVGLANVRERIQALYAGAGRVVIEEPPEGGVSICLELPQ